MVFYNCSEILFHNGVVSFVIQVNLASPEEYFNSLVKEEDVNFTLLEVDNTLYTVKIAVPLKGKVFSKKGNTFTVETAKNK